MILAEHQGHCASCFVFTAVRDHLSDMSFDTVPAETDSGTLTDRSQGSEKSHTNSVGPHSEAMLMQRSTASSGGGTPVNKGGGLGSATATPPGGSATQPMLLTPEAFISPRLYTYQC